MSAETETVSGDLSNYRGNVTVVVPGAALQVGSGAVSDTKEVPALSGTFTAIFDQAQSTIDLCSGTGTVDAQIPAGATATAPNPVWGQATCTYAPPATRCAA
jgi:hypothetical protein